MNRAIGLLLVGLLAPSLSLAAEYRVEPRSVEDRKAVYATVETVHVSQARARINGTVAELKVDEGSRVEAGQIIARIVDPKLRSQIDAIDARIESLMAERKLAGIAFERAQQLRQVGATSQAKLDEAKTQLDVVDRNVAAMRAERATALTRAGEGAVAAPAGGRVLKVLVADGAVVLPGEAIASIAHENYILRLHLPERHARFLKPGDGVQVGGRGLAGTQDAERLKSGKVVKVYPELERGQVVADVEVEGIGDYFVGERTTVFVATGSRETFVVPVEFLIRRHGLTFARLKNGGEVVVEPGLPTEGGVEVLSGLKAGDVILSADGK